MTCTVDGRDHLLNDQSPAAAQVAGRGQYAAICGHLVVAAPLVVPPGPACLDCESALHRSTTSHRRRGLVTRLLRRRLPRADSRSGTSGRRRVAQA
ncbi:MAG: hypothetical protein ACRDTE_05710 [Pseudonocardiaceae bacterium]